MDKSSLLVPVQSYMILQYTYEIYIALYMYSHINIPVHLYTNLKPSCGSKAVVLGRLVEAENFEKRQSSASTSLTETTSAGNVELIENQGYRYCSTCRNYLKCHSTYANN